MTDTRIKSTLVLRLERYAHGRTRTLGHITGGGLIAATEELPWRDNYPLLSCLSLGRYDVISHVDYVDDWVVVCAGIHLNQKLYTATDLTCGQMGIGINRYAFNTPDSDTPDISLLSMDILNELTQGLDRWRLDITYVQPYAHYISNYGYHKPEEQ